MDFVGGTLPHLFPSGINAGAFGTADVSNYTRYVTPGGVDAGAFGTAHAYNLTQIVSLLDGISQGGYGTASVINRNQNVAASGFNAFKGFGFGADGDGFVDFAIRTVHTSTSIDDVFGTALVDNQLRIVDVPHFDATSYGDAMVAYRLREVEPVALLATLYGRPMVDVDHPVNPAGLAATIFGATTVLDNHQDVYPVPMGPKGIGTAFVALDPQPVAPVGFRTTAEDALPSERWGRATVHNSRQYVYQLFEVTPSDGGVFGSPVWMQVANRNRVVSPSGWDSGRVSRFLEVANTARPVMPAGLDATLWGGTLAAYRIRTLNLDGFDAGYISHYAQAYNNARLVHAGAGEQTAFGGASVVNTRRYFNNIGAGEQTAFGTAFVSFYIRDLAHYYAYGGGIFGTAAVRNRTSYVAPGGISLTGPWGLTVVEPHRNIIANPRYVRPHDELGEPHVRNRNQTVYMNGLVQTEWGNAHPFNRNQYVTPPGWVGSVGTAPAVAYRTRTVFPNGANVGRISDHLRVDNDLPDPPPQQTVLGAGNIGPLMEGTHPLMGQPNVQGNEIFPTWVAPDTTFGHPTVHANSIYPQGIYLLPEDQFGHPVLNPAQFITVDEGIHAAIDDVRDVPLSRISPHTIWARTDTPDQAVRNHPGSHLWSAPDAIGEPNSHPMFGFPTVTHYRRTVFPHDGDETDLRKGEHFGPDGFVSFRIRRVTPTGLKAFKQGIAKINGGQEIQPHGFDMASYGATTVAPFVDPTIPRHLAPAGISTPLGEPDVSFFNREVAPQGWASFTIGLAPQQQETEPTRTTRVHFPEPIMPIGFEATQFGATWPSLWVRTVEPEGFDAGADGFDVGRFTDRLKIHRMNHVGAQGIAPGACGTPTTWPHTRELRPTYASGNTWFGEPRVAHQSIVALGGLGIDAALIGVPAKWQPGDDTTPYGFESALYGDHARIDRRMSAAGFDASALGEPVAGSAARVDGITEWAFGNPTLSYPDGAEYTCGLRPRAIAHPGFDAGSFGGATVAHV
jgi:hypothetical protein